MFFYRSSPSQSYYPQPKAPLRQVLNTMVSKKVPVRLVPNGVYQSNELPEAAQSELQDHCSLYCLVDWNTGIGIIEAADSMVQEAVSNGNIPEPPVPVKLKP